MVSLKYSITLQKNIKSLLIELGLKMYLEKVT